LIDWLIIYSFTSRSRIFHLYGDVPIAGEGLQNLGLCSVLRAFEQGDLYRATPAVTRDLDFSGLIRRTAPFSRLLRHTGGCGGSILTRSSWGPHIKLKFVLWVSLDCGKISYQSDPSCWSFAPLLCPPSKKGGHIALLLSVGRSTISFRSFSLHWLHILKWNLVYWFIVRISGSSSILGTIEPFLPVLWPLDFEKFQ
jgi:hypothetical protein